MILAEVLSWWYAAGWSRLMQDVGQRVSAILSFFSVGLLLKTLFDPFRQIDAGRVRGSLQDEWRAFANRTVSRFVGAIIRAVVILTGLICAGAVGLVGLIQIVLWPFVPFLPVIGLALVFVGWTW